MLDNKSVVFSLNSLNLMSHDKVKNECVSY